jgi:hypothetical protein
MLNIYFWKSCRLVGEKIYGKTWQATDDDIKWRTRLACWLPKATDTHSEYVSTYRFATAKIVTLTLVDITLYCIICPFSWIYLDTFCIKKIITCYTMTFSFLKFDFHLRIRQFCNIWSVPVSSFNVSFL